MSNFELRKPSTRELTGGDLLAQCLHHIGVKVAFGLHGGHLDAFLMGCESTDIKLVDTRHETVAVQAAEAYSKMTGTTGTCFGMYSNGLPGLATAFADRSSIFCITSSPPLRDGENNSLQGSIDQVVVAKPITKFAHLITHAEDIPRLVAHAMKISSCGPVLIDFPIDVLFSPIIASRISWGSITSPLPYPPGPHTKAIENATQALFDFVEATQIPLFHSPKICFSLPTSSPLYAGSAGNLALLPHMKSPTPDLVILLGARTGMYMGGRSGAIIPSPDSCKLVQIDTDGGEIGRTLPVDLGIVSDATEALLAFNAALPKHNYVAPNEWVKIATDLKNIPMSYASDPEIVEGKLHPYHALAAVFKSIPDGSIVVTDGGECGAWASGAATISNPHAIISATGYLGFLGNGFGYSLGCAFADPSRLIVNIQGDGSAGFHFMELDTYARFSLRILTIVVNNHAWGMSSNGQELIYGTKNPARPISSLSPKTAYDVVAQGLGNKSAKVEQLADVQGAVTKLLAGDGPGCMNLIVSRRPTHPITESMVGMTEDENMIVVPYYDNVPRPYYRN
ncbi:thiamine diphosphate-binding protein [Mytilinidion resinicola]|uniref:Thiamine diphosphate-binding protein n=1 Tax=Mytilinidion resinicola TaxID=574789 RepID=A0A6A6ZAN8_9PEZI|nr:thiamine diphosphate-binding protein [Mytilinidion resinicola]KAF2817277.1 thiamine diphosphate-binding protein [Mytilinidion resinicola]